MMNPPSPAYRQADQNQQKAKTVPTVSAILKDGSIVETLYDPSEGKTEFAVWKGDNWTSQKEIRIDESTKMVPFSPKNNLIRNGVILLPSHPEEYGSEEDLISSIQSFIHKYVDVSSLFEKIASYYVLFTWIYDDFNELPYLRLRGEPGSGKTRFLLTVGSICNKPIFTSGASTISPIFRILDAVRGTLIIDESDFRFSDEKAELTKILNQGNVKGFPVLRSEPSPITKEYDPVAYHVFGPKIIASRGFFEDKALESRLFTEEIGQRKLREDIPINLPDSYKDEALELRNKLLLFRFRNLHKKKIVEGIMERTIEPRLNQIFTPLLSIVEDAKTVGDIKELAMIYNDQMISDRGLDVEAQVLDTIKDLSRSDNPNTPIKEIVDAFNEKYGEEYDRKISPKFIGSIIRSKLSLKTKKQGGVFLIPASEIPKLTRLYERYGLQDTPPASPSAHLRASPQRPQSPHAPSADSGQDHSAPTGTSPQCPHDHAMPTDGQAMSDDSQSSQVSPSQEPHLFDG